MKFSKKKSVLLFAGLCALCIAALCLQALRPQGTVAIVECDGEQLLAQPLSALSAPQTVSITGKNNITLQIELTPTGAAVLSSQCPDQICVHTGTLTRAGQSAICLPAQVVLRLEGAKNLDGTV